MNKRNFKKSKIAASIAVLLTTGISSSVLAAQTEESAMEVIEISGIRGSLIRSMQMKREAKGVVDVISAEDMGKFPDTNLAESLQRITGVAVSRSNGEGSEITVRGFGPDFNIITLNGRQMPATGNSRSYKLENLASEGINELQVMKTARAENPSGGLGATVNINTIRPLESPGLKWTVMGKGIHDSSNVEGDDVTPEFSAVFSNTFNDEMFGIAASVVHHRRDFQKQRANVQGWQANVALPNNDCRGGPVLDDTTGEISHREIGEECASYTDSRDYLTNSAGLRQLVDKSFDPLFYGENNTVVDADGNTVELADVYYTKGAHYFPRSMNYSFENVSRERTNGYVSLQFAPTDNIVATVDYNFGKALTGSNSLGWGVWHDYGGNINEFELDENGTAVYVDFSGNDASYTASRSVTETKESSLGFNLAWQITDNFDIELDYHDSSNEADNGADEGLGSVGSLVLGSDTLVNKTYDYRTGEIPQTQVFWENGTTTLNANEIDSHFSQFIHSPGKSEVEQFQFHGSWENETDSSLVNVKFGFAHADQLIGGSSAWSGLIGGFLFAPDYTAMLPDSLFTKHDTADLLDQFDGGGSDLTLDYYYDFDFDDIVAYSEAFLTNEELGGDDYFATDAYHPKGTYAEGSVQEVTTSVYLQSQFEFDLLDFPAQLNVGMRYEETEVTSRVKQDVPTEVWWLGGSEWHTQLESGDDTFFVSEGSHDVFMPMFDLKVDFSDELVGRMSWGKTLARAPLGDLAGARFLSGSPKIGSRSGSDGNPSVKPYVSTNFDLSLEYYYGEGSYASIGYFNKQVDDWIGTDVFQVEIEGMHDIYQSPRWNQAVADLEAAGEQTTNDAIFAQIQANGATLNAQGYLEPLDTDPLIQWDIRKPFNSDRTFKVNGLELAVQHLFGESGFGVGLNTTFMEPSEKYNTESLDVQVVLAGASDSANLQAFYEKHGLSIKTTYAWREGYLRGIGQDQGSSDNPPQHPKEFGQWDISINYDITENLTIFAEGINLNNETEQTYGRYERQFLEANQYGTRYVLGARLRFK